MGEVLHIRKEYEPGYKQIGEAENTHNTGDRIAAATEFTDGVTKVRDNVRNQLDLPSRVKGKELDQFFDQLFEEMGTWSEIMRMPAG